MFPALVCALTLGCGASEPGQPALPLHLNPVLTMQTSGVAAGPNGLAYSEDNGLTWITLDDRSHWSVAFANLRSGWVVGPEGRVTHIRLFE